MTLKLAYRNPQFYEDVKKVLEDYSLVNLEAFCSEVYNERKNYFKLKNAFGTVKDTFMVLVDNESNVIQPFYEEDKTCTTDYLIVVLNHWVLYNPIEDGRSGDQETA